MSDVVLIEWYNAHYYKVTADDGQVHYLPSVTTKLGIIDKPQLTRWYGDLGTREAELRKHEAAEKGTRIHWAYAVSLTKGAVAYNPWQKPIYTEEGLAQLKEKYGTVAILRTQEEMHAISKLAEQFKRLEPEVLGVEKLVYDLEMGDAGTIDSIFWIEEGEYFIAGQKPLRLSAGIYINDLKTGSFLSDDVWLQLAPYVVMYEKRCGAKVQGALVTHTGSTIKTGIPGLKTMHIDRDQIEQYYKQYRRISDVWLDKHAGEQPETFHFPSLITMQKKEN